MGYVVDKILSVTSEIVAPFRGYKHEFSVGYELDKILSVTSVRNCSSIAEPFRG